MNLGSAPSLEPLPLAAWEQSKTTLHLWSQIVGKIRLKSTPHRNHWWNLTLAFTPRGLAARGMRVNGIDFELEFDFIDHRLVGRTSLDRSAAFPLADRLSVADFYAQTLVLLRELEIDIPIVAKPYGMPVTTPFAEDREHNSYDRAAVRRWWDIARWTSDMFDVFASDFVGKQSPAQLFWHTFDVAMSRYNGKLAPIRDGASLVEREAYSHEVIAVGFWAGDSNVPAPTYYTYTAPEPPTLTQQTLDPADARWIKSGSGHIGALAYETVRTAADPQATLLGFLQSGYRAGTLAAGWDTRALASLFPG